MTAFRLLSCVVLLCGSAGSLASETLLQPFAVRNLNPFIGIYGVPTMVSTQLAPNGSARMNLTLDVASHFTDNNNASEQIQIDGETYRIAFRYVRGVADGWEAGVELPLIHHSGGMLDGFINRWHDAFSLPTLGRDEVADNQLSFAYSRDGADQVNVQDSTTGAGDVTVFTARQILADERSRLSLHGQLKLPTGDPDRLMGSGGLDVAAWITASRSFGGRWLGAGQLGLAYLGPGDVLTELQRHWVGFASMYLGWRASSAVALKAQLDAQTPVYEDSDFHQLADPAVQITVGGSVRVTKSDFVDFGVTEDEINYDVSPDVTFQLRWRRAI